MSARRDRVAHAIASWVLRTIATQEYRNQLDVLFIAGRQRIAELDDDAWFAELRPPGGEQQRQQRMSTRIERRCRDCGTTFMIPAAEANNHNKWYSLCAHCLRWEQ